MTRVVNIAQSGGNNVTMRNRIINGAMVIDQRNAGASVSISSYGYAVDRWGYQCSGGGVWTSQRSSTAPAGFSNSLALTVTTADASIVAADVYQLFHKLEGFNTADFGWGTANAQPITVSFWVRSSITGTYSVGFVNNAFNRTYAATVTVNAANTFEYKTVTILGDTSGTWTTDNSIGLQLAIDLGSGSNQNVTAGAWATTSGVSCPRTSGSVNWIGTNGATFYITGVQLEAGTTATPFEQRLYGTELALCQRYFEVDSGGSAIQYQLYQLNASDIGRRNNVAFKITKRAAPTCTLTGGVNSPAVDTASINSLQCVANPSNTTTSVYFAGFTASAEL